MLNNVMLSLSLWGYHSSSYIFDCSAISSSRLFFVVVFLFFLLVIRGVPSLILAQTQVSAPLNSRPVDGYRKGGATPILYVYGVQLSLVVGTCCMWAWSM